MREGVYLQRDSESLGVWFRRAKAGSHWPSGSEWYLSDTYPRPRGLWGAQQGCRPEAETEPEGLGGRGETGAVECSLVGLPEVGPCCPGADDFKRERAQI